MGCTSLKKPFALVGDAESRHIAVFIIHLPFGWALQSQNHTGQRRFAATALACQRKDFRGMNLAAQMMHDQLP